MIPLGGAVLAAGLTELDRVEPLHNPAGELELASPGEWVEERSVHIAMQTVSMAASAATVLQARARAACSSEFAKFRFSAAANIAATVSVAVGRRSEHRTPLPLRLMRGSILGYRLVAQGAGRDPPKWKR